MKITVANLSSNLLVVPPPLNLTLTGGKSVTAVLKEQDWKAAQNSPAVQRLLRAKMLALTPLDEVPAAPAPAPAPEATKAPKVKAEAPPKVEEPKEEPKVETPKAEPEAPVADPVATEPATEPATDAAAAAEDDGKKKKKDKKKATW